MERLLKNLLLLLLLMFAENGWSCSLVGDEPSKSINSELVIGSDTVVWVEYLSHVKSETQKPDDMSQELFDVQGMIAGYSIKNSHTYSFNELETLKGSLKSLSFKFTDQNLFPRFAASNLIEGSRYILVINDGSIKAVIEAGSDKVYSSLKEIVNTIRGKKNSTKDALYFVLGVKTYFPSTQLPTIIGQ